MKRIPSLTTALLVCASTAFSAVTIDPVSRTFAKEGGAGAVLTRGSGTWTATTDASWITLSRASGDAGVSCVYIVNANMTADVRIGTIDIGGNTHTVSQTGYTASLDRSSDTIGHTGGTGTVTVSLDAGISWSATANADWLSVTPTAGMSAGSVTYEAAPYDGITPRTGSITIAGQTFSITQTGRPLVISPTSFEKEYGADIMQVTISALSSTSWEVLSQTSWISVVDPGNGVGNSTVLLAVGQNPSVLPRTGTVSIGTETVTVHQSGYPNPSLSITPTSATADASGANGHVAVYATPDATWTAESLDSWILLTAGSSGAGNGNLSYIVTPNPEITERSGRIMFNPPAFIPEVDYVAGLAAWNTGATSFDGSRTVSVGLSSESQAVAFKFKIGMMDSVHRIVSCGDQAIWVDADNVVATTSGRTSFQIDDTATSYTVLVNGTDLWIGQTGTGDLSLVGTSLILTPNGTLVFGYANMSAPTHLSSGTITGSVLWNRKLSEMESRKLGWSTAFPSSDATFPNMLEKEPDGCPQGISMSHSPFSGNGWASVNKSSVPSGLWSCGTAMTLNRFGQPYRAVVTSAGGGFSGQHGIQTGTSATYNIWLRFSELPNNSSTIFNQTLHPQHSVGSPYNDVCMYVITSVPSSKSRLLQISSSGDLIWKSGSSESTFTANLDTAIWHMITVVGNGTSTIDVYADGVKVGRINTGYPIGNSDETYTYTRTYWDHNHYVSSNTKTDTGTYAKSFSLGGFSGAVDEITIFAGALSAEQVKTLYDAGKPPVLYHTVTQGAAADPDVSPDAVAFGASGGNAEITVSAAPIVSWSASEDSDWISFLSSTDRLGSGTITFEAAPNPNIESRSTTITVAGKTITVEQKGLAANVTYSGGSFGTDGGSGFIQVDITGNANWTAESKADWITIVYGESGSNSGETMFVVDPYSSAMLSRTGVIRVAGQDVYITQCGYELSISPSVAEIGSNAGAGEFGVAAPIGAIWEALATEDWITLVGGQTGIGNGTLHYTVADNATGQTRTGRIIVAGQEYTITQLASYKLETEVDGGGSVSGAGNYDVNATATLTANPANGYAFSHWSGDAVGVDPTVSFTMDTSKTVTAHFIPAEAARAMVSRAAASEGLYTTEQMHELTIGDSVIDLDHDTGDFEVGVRLQRRASLGEGDWEDVDATAGNVSVGADGRVRIRVQPEGNAAFFRFVNKGEEE